MNTATFSKTAAIRGNMYPSLHLALNVKVGFNGCCGFFGLFGHVLKVVLPNVSPVSVAGIFRGQHSDQSTEKAFANI